MSQKFIQANKISVIHMLSICIRTASRFENADTDIGLQLIVRTTVQSVRKSFIICTTQNSHDARHIVTTHACNITPEKLHHR